MRVILHYPDQGNGGYTADLAYGMSNRLEGEICVKYYSKFRAKFCLVNVVTDKLSRKHREVFALLSFVPDIFTVYLKQSNISDSGDHGVGTQAVAEVQQKQ